MHGILSNKWKVQRLEYLEVDEVLFTADISLGTTVNAFACGCNREGAEGEVALPLSSARDHVQAIAPAAR